jgi:tetratricopeptide (TPR) repeat protein
MKKIFTIDEINKMLYEFEKEKYADTEKTIKVGLEIYSLCNEMNYETGIAVVLCSIGQAYLNMSKYENAMIYLLDSINLAKKLNICDVQLRGYLVIGDIYFDIEEYEKSLDYYDSAEKLVKILDRSNKFYNLTFENYAAKIYNRIGEIYRVLKCYEDAIEFYYLALEIEKKMNYIGTFGTVLSNIGNTQYHLGNYESALEFLNESIIYLIKYDYKNGLVEAYETIALINEKKVNYDECEKYFSKAMEVSIKSDYVYNHIDLQLDYINFLQNAGKLELAIIKVEEVYQISIENMMYAKTIEICKKAILLYEMIKLVPLFLSILIKRNNSSRSLSLQNSSILSRIIN